jgi:hypothetical protein
VGECHGRLGVVRVGSTSQPPAVPLGRRRCAASFWFSVARVESKQSVALPPSPTGRESMSSPTLQTLQESILLLRWVFRAGRDAGDSSVTQKGV